ncbi:MAG: PEPxxWA-CTERM sorting domain-containing protein [Pseudomonadota bacterium]
MTKTMLKTAAFALLAAGAASTASATTTITASDSGWYRDSGAHSPSNRNVFTGGNGSDELRSFFVFDLTGLSAASSLSVTFPINGRFATDTGTETVNFYDYTGSITSLVGGTGGVSAFNDLGSGALLGQQTITAANNSAMPEFTFVLPLSFVSQFNAAIGSGDQRIAFGASMQTLLPGGAGEAFWSFSDNRGANAAQLNITPTAAIPEPATWALMLLGFFAAGAAMRRKPSVRSVSVRYS